MQENESMISVIMGVYYRRDNTHLLERAVQSILKQNYTRLEVLIEDDGSTEAAKQYLDELARQDGRIRLLRGYEAMTLSQKLNICLREASGEFIARMDDDDYSYSNRLEMQLDFLRTHDDIDFVGSNVDLICDGEVIGSRRLPKYPTVRDFYMTQPYIHSAMMFRRTVFERVNSYSEARCADKCEDYDLLLRLYSAGYHGANLQDTLLDYTVRTDAHGGRTMKDRWHETQTRYARFRELRQFPYALPYVVKPLVVGLIPKGILKRIKNRRMNRR